MMYFDDEDFSEGAFFVKTTAMGYAIEDGEKNSLDINYHCCFAFDHSGIINFDYAE